MLRRPIVPLAVFVFILIYLILGFPQYFYEFLAICLILCPIFAIILVKRKEYVLLALVIPVILLSAFIARHSFIKYEQASNEVISELKDKNNVRFSAIVNDCGNYTKYSVVNAKLLTADGKELETPLNARMSCFSGYVFSEGDTVVFDGTPISVSEIESDGFDTQSHLKSKKTFIEFPSVSVISASPGKNRSVFSRLRSFTQEQIYKYVRKDYDFNAASVCYAVFAGDRNNIPKQIRRSFSQSGLTHLLCVSGMHLAILAGTVYSLLSIFSLHKRLRCGITIVLCVVYTIFTGLSLSTVRACIMCCLGYMGMMSGRKTDAYISLFFSLLAICLVSPYSVFDISLILSFCATLGIVSVCELLPEYTGNKKLMRFAHSVASAFISNTGAVAFTLPVCAISFGGISTVSVLSTLSVSFIFQTLLILLLFLMLLSPLQPVGVLNIIGKVCHMTCNAIIKISDFFSGFKFSSVDSAFPHLFALLFILLIFSLSIFIAFDLSLPRRICIWLIIVLGVAFTTISLVCAIIDDGLYKVTYYRKNEDDRQLSIKLESEGYLLVNADSILCSNSDDLPFDTKHGKNYLFIVPDNNINPSVLCENIRIFDSRFGIEKILLPETDEGVALSEKLYESKIVCSLMPVSVTVGTTCISYNFDGAFRLSVKDKDVKTEIVFGDSYNTELFAGGDICAFFTRRTKNQFNLQKDQKPDCGIFFTRLKKGEAADGIQNTFGEKSVVIKG